MRFFAPVALLALAACSATNEYDRELPPGSMALRKITDPDRVPDFSDGYHARGRVIEAIDRSLEYLAKPSSEEHYPYLDISHDRAVKSLHALKRTLASTPSGRDLHRQLVERFDVYESVGWDGDGSVLFTAYCEPIYEGSLEKTTAYRYPLYGLPHDLVKAKDGTPVGRRTRDGGIVPYHTRRDIEERDLLKGLELVYLKNPVEAFIIHVQGSARIRLRNGSQIRIGYAGKTDRPYTSIGAELIRDGRIPRSKMSLQKLKDFFRTHPKLVQEYLHRNECYVFFTRRDGGPYGSLNVPLTPLASIATDKSVFPRAAPAFLVTRIPRSSYSPESFRTFAMDQDTGGAIRSAGRTDIYYGSGPVAEARAGRTHAEGRLFYLFVKQ